MENQPSLLPCPFCGGHAKTFGGGLSQEDVTTICLECFAELPGGADRWNERWDVDLNTLAWSGKAG